MILFNNFKAHYAQVQPLVEPAIQRVLQSGWYVLGQEVQAFERELAASVGAAHAVGVASGTDAITLALMALGIGPGAEVITTNLTAYPTITGIQRAGATPVVAEVEAGTALLSPAAVARAITPRTRAIIPVHLYGQCADLSALRALADQQGLALIEDCAQSAGATWQGRGCGTVGELGCYSFYPTKNLGCFGDGGAVVTQTAALTEKLLMLRNYGQKNRYRHELPGLNSRLDELQAAILRAKLPLLPTWNARRQAMAARYRAELRTVTPLGLQPGSSHVYHLFVVRLAPARRADFMAHLLAQGVQSLIHYPITVNRQPDFAGGQGPSLPVSEALAESIVSLPIYPELSDADVAQVIHAVNSFSG